MNDFAFDMLDPRYFGHIWRDMEACAYGNMGAIERALLVPLEAIHVCDAVFPLWILGLYYGFYIGDATFEFHEGCQVKALNIRLQIVYILRQRYMVWCRKRKSVVGEGS